MISQEDAKDSTPQHQPDYNATIDHATSYVLVGVRQFWPS